MSLTTSIIMYAAGIVAAGLIGKFLRQQVSEAIAVGVSAMVILLAMYPLTIWIAHGPRQNFSMYVIWCVIGALTGIGLMSLRRSK